MTATAVSSLLELVRAVVRHELGALRQPALGVLTAVHPHKQESDELGDEVDVRLRYEGLTLPRVPVAVPQPGAAAPLKVGDLVLVQFVGGDLQQALVTACFHHADDRPPVHEADELVVEQRVVSDSSRNQLRFAADGSVHVDRKIGDDGTPAASIVLTKDGDVIVTAKEKVTITCTTLTVKGAAVIDGGDLTVKNGKALLSNGSTTTEVDGNKITGKPGGAP